MATRGLQLIYVTASQGEGGATTGLWLFFSDIDGPESTPMSWWKELRAKKALGASLTVTGVFSLLCGLAFHYALRTSIISSSTHLGYFFGLVGLLLFLIG